MASPLGVASAGGGKDQLQCMCCANAACRVLICGDEPINDQKVEVTYHFGGMTVLANPSYVLLCS